MFLKPILFSSWGQQDVTIPRIHYTDLPDKELNPETSESGYVTNITLVKEPKGFFFNNDPVSGN